MGKHNFWCSILESSPFSLGKRGSDSRADDNIIIRFVSSVFFSEKSGKVVESLHKDI